MSTPKAIWLIWLQRNKFIFQFGRIDPNTYSHCIKKEAEFFAIVPDNSNKPNRTQVQVKWKKPIPNWVKLNKEESIFGKPKKAGGRRVLHSSNKGTWNLELGSISSTMAKLWTLKMAFSLARQLNLENINLELDAEVLVYMLFSLSSVNLMSETLLTDFRNLMRSLLTAQWLIFIGNPSW